MVVSQKYQGDTTMRNKGQDDTVRHDVIQRYCPRRSENVIMLRTYGETPRLQCMNYDLCDCEKDTLCGCSESPEPQAEG